MEDAWREDVYRAPLYILCVHNVTRDPCVDGPAGACVGFPAGCLPDSLDLHRGKA